MARLNPSKEATLKEVLAEVSLADVGGMLKNALIGFGCLGAFLAVVLAISFAAQGAGVGMPDLGIPDWVWWTLFAWLFAYQATSNQSYHELSWYFPKLGWFGSLVLAAYMVGLVMLVLWVMDQPIGVERGIAFFAVWFGYGLPLWFLLAVTSHGHAKLMEKRNAEAAATDRP